MIDIIIVEPKFPENLGFIARLMKNFGFKNLIVLKPRFDIEKAYITATHGKDILDNAKILNKSLKDIRKDYDLLIATSGKVFKENFRRKYVTPEELANFLKNNKFNKVGIVFGREDIGLTNEEIDVCDALLHIPTSEEFPILNLSHSVGIVLYILYRELKYIDKRDYYDYNFKALWEYLDFIVNKLKEKNLKVKENFNISIRKVFYNLLIRAKIDKKEYSILMGFFNLIKKYMESFK